MRQILLINPSNRDDPLERVRTLALPPLNLALLAGCTPDRYQVAIVDETLEELDLDQPADLVGITCMTPLAPRAYEIATAFRQRGVKVVLGGIHASMLPAEASRFADAVVCGEAEGIWPTVLEEAEADKLRPLYQPERASLEHLPRPRRELLPDGYFVQTVQTSRGCPFDCDFCSVTRMNGGQYRMRPVSEVVDEIARLPGDRFFFVDDNIAGSGPACTQRAAALFDGLRGLRKSWASQACITMADDAALLAKAAASGAKMLFIGFESADDANLLALNKRVNLRLTRGGLRQAVQRCHDHGIAVVGGIILGCDRDDGRVFQRTLEFVSEIGLDGVQLTIQTPFPGTRLHERLAHEGRLFHHDFPRDWRRYNGFEVVFRPLGLSETELAAGHLRTYRAVAALGPALLGAARTLARTRSVLGTAVAFSWTRDCYTALRARAAPEREPSAGRTPSPAATGLQSRRSTELG